MTVYSVNHNTPNISYNQNTKTAVLLDSIIYIIVYLIEAIALVYVSLICSVVNYALILINDWVFSPILDYNVIIKGYLYHMPNIRLLRVLFENSNTEITHPPSSFLHPPFFHVSCKQLVNLNCH